jgi:regulator of sirC expression with transglutaminase-like and TPR domain
MDLMFDVPTPLEFFASLVQDDSDFALLEAAICLAQDEYPEVDVQSVLEAVDQLQARLKRRLPADAGPLHKLRLLNQFFFQDLKFGGNVNDCYDPDNSMIHVLLHTRCGIPISLAVLWMELAQGLGLAVRGVGFPGHFLIKVNLPMGQVLIDPMSGRSLSREALAELVEPYRHGGGQTDDLDAPLGLYLQVSSPREIIARMLRNLKEIYRSQNDWQRLLPVLQRLIILLPQSWQELRDRGLAHAELGQVPAAILDLEEYLLHACDLTDVQAVAEQLDALRRLSDSE